MPIPVAILRKLLREPPVPVLSRLSGLDDRELGDRLRMVAHLKRFFERYCADPDFRQRLNIDLPATLDAFHLSVDPADVHAVLEINRGRAAGWTPNLHLFRDFMLECQGGLEYGELAAASAHPKFRAWRERQVARLRFDFSRYGDGIVRPAAALELSKGCTVGCWFCAISAERFGGNLEYATGRELWRESLRQLYGLLGPAAASSCCYWATDPFDNPDYERFAMDFYEICGVFPPATTALPLKSPRRTRALLELSQAHGCRLNRFSVLTRGMLDRLHREFTPEDLVLVELALQQPDALIFTNFPSTTPAAKVRAGRVMEPAQSAKLGGQPAVSGTIACVVGFLINMVEHSIQLVSPCTATEEWPMGYRIHASDTFMDDSDLRKRLEQMIDQHAPERIPPDRRVQLMPGIHYSRLPDGFRLSTPQHVVDFRPATPGVTYNVLGNLVRDGDRTAAAVTAELEANGASPQEAAEALDAVFASGALSDGVTKLLNIAPPVPPQRSPIGRVAGLIQAVLLLALALPLSAQTQLVAQNLPSPTAPPQRTLGIVQAGQITIDQNPILQIQKQQVNFSQGTLLVESSIFDLNLGVAANQGRNYSPLTKSAAQSAMAAGIDTGSQNTNSTNTNLNASKLFRSGISVTPSLHLVRNTDNLTNQTGLNNSTLGVQVVLPLLRNRGRAVVAARETSASLEINAAGYDLSQTASQLLASVAIAYWNYLGALQSLDIFRASEQRGQTLLDNVRALAVADIIPRIEIDNAVANLASRTATRISAEQTAIQAQQQLALAMGLSASDVLDLPPPGDPFPDGTTQPLLPTDSEKLREYIRLALSRRADYLAAKTRSEESRILLGAAQNQLKPQLDFVGNIGYAGLQETTRFDKYLSSSFQNIYGPSVVGGIEYHFPLQNRAARGQIVQSQASLQQQDLRVMDIARNVASNVVTAATGLNNSVLQLKQAREASASFLAALNGERDRLRLGASSVLDVLQTEDRYINSTVNEISAKVGYAIAIANFRLATGTYLQPDQPVQSVAREAFYVPIVP